MNFQEICREAELTRDEIYGLQIGDKVVFVADLEEKQEEEERETEYRRKKRLRAENVERYRQQLQDGGEIQYDGHIDEISLNNNLIGFVGAAMKVGLIEEITEDDFLDDTL